MTAAKENFMGFKIAPFDDCESLYRTAANIGQRVYKTHATETGFIYSYGNKWWDQDGEIIGLHYLLDT